MLYSFYNKPVYEYGFISQNYVLVYKHKKRMLIFVQINNRQHYLPLRLFAAAYKDRYKDKRTKTSRTKELSRR